MLHSGKIQLKDDKNFKVGLCWQGNPNYSTHFLRLVVACKSLSPAAFAPLGTIPGISFYSLQKDHADNVDETLPEGFIVHPLDANFDKDNGRFMDTAALMKNLDLVITVDTSIAHLAEGLAFRYGYCCQSLQIGAGCLTAPIVHGIQPCVFLGKLSQATGRWLLIRLVMPLDIWCIISNFLVEHHFVLYTFAYL